MFVLTDALTHPMGKTRLKFCMQLLSCQSRKKSCGSQIQAGKPSQKNPKKPSLKLKLFFFSIFWGEKNIHLSMQFPKTQIFLENHVRKGLIFQKSVFKCFRIFQTSARKMVLKMATSLLSPAWRGALSQGHKQIFVPSVGLSTFNTLQVTKPNRTE